MRRGGGSLDLKCCSNALTDEGMRAVSSLTVFTSLELWGCSKVTDERMRAQSRWAHVQEVQHAQAGLR